MALLSHLDVMRLLERALRRSSLPVSYSGGFHSLPSLQIALALPLGVEAFGEWMDLEFVEPVEAETMRQQLQVTLPKGLSLLSAESVPVGGSSLSQLLVAASWRFDLAIESEKPSTWHQWQVAVEFLKEAHELLWHDTDKKGRPRQRDCRPALRELQLCNRCEEGGESLCLDVVQLRLEASIDSMGRSLKPVQVKHWLAEQMGESLRIPVCKVRNSSCCSVRVKKRREVNGNFCHWSVPAFFTPILSKARLFAARSFRSLCSGAVRHITHRSF